MEIKEKRMHDFCDYLSKNYQSPDFGNEITIRSFIPNENKVIFLVWQRKMTFLEKTMIIVPFLFLIYFIQSRTTYWVAYFDETWFPISIHDHLDISRDFILKGYEDFNPEYKNFASTYKFKPIKKFKIYDIFVIIVMMALVMVIWLAIFIWMQENM